MLNREIEEWLKIVVERVESSDKNDIVSAIKHLDFLLENCADKMDERLIHFLKRRSYQKALSFLRDSVEVN